MSIQSQEKRESPDLKDLQQISLTRRLLEREGISDLDTIARGYGTVWEAQNSRREYYYDYYTECGSDAAGIIISDEQGIRQDCVIWSVNHYLALNRHPYVISRAQQALEVFGTGSGTSAASGGHSSLHQKIQRRLANLLGKESALLYSTGFTANLGAIAGITGVGNHLVLIDREAHASLIEGCRLSRCKYLPFRHNSIADLERKLNTYGKRYDNVLVIVESAYSMSGDEAPLAEIVELKKKYGFRLYVDEAHSFGFYGKQGSGMCSQLGIQDDVDFIMTTLSKSTASIGGVVAMNNDIRVFLTWESNAYLFQAAISPVDAAAIDASLDIIENEPEHAKSLWEKNTYFRTQLLQQGFNLGLSKSPVIPIYVGDSEKLYLMGKELFKNGIFTVPVTYPAVHYDESRFRFIVNNSHTYDQIDYTVKILSILGRKYGII